MTPGPGCLQPLTSLLTCVVSNVSPDLTASRRLASAEKAQKVCSGIYARATRPMLAISTFYKILERFLTGLRLQRVYIS